MDTFVTCLNSVGKYFIDFSLPMLIQSSVLIVILLALDLLLRKKVQAVFRYFFWMLVLVKLLLPATLSAPTGLGYWLGDKLPQITTEQSFSAIQPTTISPESELVLDDTPSEIIKATPSPITKSTTSVNMQELDKTEVATTSSPLKPLLSWQAIVFMLWLAVIITMVLLMIQKLFFVRGLIAQSQDASGEILDLLTSCRKQMGLKRKIALKLSPNATSPSVCGLFQPVILLPQGLSEELDTQHLKAILLHELVHIKRGDLWISFLQTILQIVYFYNPLLWLANIIIRRIREQAVDEMVLVVMGEQAEDYPNTLLTVSRLAFSRPTLSLRLIGVVESKSSLRRRIQHMVSQPFPKTAKLGLVGLLVVLVTAVVLLPMARGQSKIDFHIFGITIKRGTNADKNVEYAEGSQLKRAYMEALLNSDDETITNLTSAANETTRQLRLSFNEIDKLTMMQSDYSYPPSKRITLSTSESNNNAKIGLFSGGRIKRIDGIPYHLLVVITQENDNPWQLKDARWYHTDTELQEANKVFNYHAAQSCMALAKFLNPDKAASLDPADIEKEFNLLSEKTGDFLEAKKKSESAGPTLYGYKVTEAREEVVPAVQAFVDALRTGVSDSQKLRCPESLLPKLQRLPELCQLDAIQIQQIYSNNSFAIVLTDGNRQHNGQSYQLGLTFLVYPDGKWTFNDIDWITPQTRESFINGFIDNFPNVKCVYNNDEPLAEPTQNPNSPFSATLPNGVTVELVGFSHWTDGKVQWFSPSGSPIQIPNVYEADVDGMGSVIALRVTPSDPNVWFSAQYYEGQERKGSRVPWKVGPSNLWMVPLGIERQHINLFLETSRPGLWQQTEIIPVDYKQLFPKEDEYGNVEINRFGISMIHGISCNKTNAFAKYQHSIESLHI